VLRLAGQFRSRTRLERLKTGGTALPKLATIPKARNISLYVLLR
jgi:hypothetical protein